MPSRATLRLLMPDKAPLGLVCGDGWLPRELISRLEAASTPFFILAFNGMTPADMTDGRAHARVRLGAGGRAIKALRAAGCRDLAMAGGLKRPPRASLRPDLWTAAFLARTGVYRRGDDSLLQALIGVLERDEGFRVLDPGDLMPNLIAPGGALGACHPKPEANAGIRRAIAAARAVGAADAGQAAVADALQVWALESDGGTAAMLAALAQGGGAPGAVLAKTLKPGQDTRIDRPAIGPDTVDQAAAAGLAGIAVEAGGALVLDRANLTAKADARGLFVVGAALAADA